MTARAAEKRKQASERIHMALDDLLPRLAADEIDRLAEDIASLAPTPRIFVRALTFAKSVASDTPRAARADRTLPRLKIVGKGHGDLIDEREGLERLAQTAVEVSPETWSGSEVLGPEALSQRLKVARSTVHNWRRDHLVIALRKGVRNHVYPLRQFVGSKPVGGIAPVIEAIGDPEEAWEWLVTPNAHTGGKEPIEFLRRGQADVVVSASKSALDFA
jgi:hypothetical protein